MNWYLAKIIFQIISGSGNHTPQFDEQLRLIEASDSESALQKARRLGERDQPSFINAHGRYVKWNFIDVAELIPLSNQADGAEVFSRVEECDFAEAYIELVRHKADQLLRGNDRKILQLL